MTSPSDDPIPVSLESLAREVGDAIADGVAELVPALEHPGFAGQARAAWDDLMRTITLRAMPIMLRVILRAVEDLGRPAGAVAPEDGPGSRADRIVAEIFDARPTVPPGPEGVMWYDFAAIDALADRIEAFLDLLHGRLADLAGYARRHGVAPDRIEHCRSQWAEPENDMDEHLRDLRGKVLRANAAARRTNEKLRSGSGRVFEAQALLRQARERGEDLSVAADAIAAELGENGDLTDTLRWYRIHLETGRSLGDVMREDEG